MHTHTHTIFDFIQTLPYCTYQLKNTICVCLSIITHPSICPSVQPSIFHSCGELNICLSIHLSSLLNLHVSLSFSIFTIHQSPTHPSIHPPFKGSPACTHTHLLTPSYLHTSIFPQTLLSHAVKLQLHHSSYTNTQTIVIMCHSSTHCIKSASCTDTPWSVTHRHVNSHRGRSKDLTVPLLRLDGWLHNPCLTLPKQ